MSDRYSKVNQCLRKYIDGLIADGQNIMTIMESLRGGHIPADLQEACNGEDPGFIRSRAQIMLSKYLVKQHQEQSAIIPENDILVPQLEATPTIGPEL